LPIIVYTGKSLSKDDQIELDRLSNAIVVKDARSPDRLLSQTTLFLHRVEANLPESKRRILRQMHGRDPQLTDRPVLIVDDDMRNIFATKALLDQHGMRVLYAENGPDAIRILCETPEIDVVLMDIMMPKMDGYETMRRIRSFDQFKQLPIIALTAKAMKGDRDKCIEAGASDYISKPADSDQLLSLLRVWLYR